MSNFKLTPGFSSKIIVGNDSKLIFIINKLKYLRIDKHKIHCHLIMNVHSSPLKVRRILKYLLGINEQHPYNFLKKGIVFTFLTVQIQ